MIKLWNHHHVVLLYKCFDFQLKNRYNISHIYLHWYFESFRFLSCVQLMSLLSDKNI